MYPYHRLDGSKAAEWTRRIVDCDPMPPTLVMVTRGAAHEVEFVNEAHRAAFDSAGWIGHPLKQVCPFLEGADVLTSFDRVLASGETIRIVDQALTLYRPNADPDGGPGCERLLSFTLAPLRAADGSPRGVIWEGHDVAEARRLKAMVDQNERRFRHVADTAPVMIWTADSQGVCTWFNRPWLAYTGRSLEQEQGDGWTEGVHSEDLGPLTTLYRQAFEQRQPFRTEYRLRRHDGEWRLLDDAAVPRFGDDGSFLGYIGSCTDVTEQRASADAMRRSAAVNAKFRSMFEQGSQLAALLSPEGLVIDVNRSALEGTGYTRADAIGRPFWECGWWSPLPQLAAVIKEACASAAAGRSFRSEMSYFTATGEERCADVVIAPVFDDCGTVLFLNPLAIDVTSRRDAELALLASQEQLLRQQRLYEAILSNTPDAAYVLGQDRRFIYANDGMLRILGRTAGEVIGKRMDGELGYGAALAAMLAGQIDGVLASGRAICGDTPFTGGLGEREYQYIFVPVFDAAGNIEAVAGTSRDVTEYKENERTLRLLADEIRTVDRRKTEFLAMLAHELRNPLAPIANAVQILKHAADQPDKVQTCVTMMQRQVQHLGRLVDDLIDVSRVSRGSIQIRREYCDLETVIQQAAESSRPAIEALGQQLVVHSADRPLSVRGDQVRLTQIVSNLLNNASKYSRSGSRIDLSLRAGEAGAVISVRDQGIGIAADKLAEIFEMFAQIDGNAEQSRSGLGIGLALVDTLVKLHGGSVRAISAGLGQGSEFVVSLPVIAEPLTGTPAASQSALAPEAAGQGRRILIVDDNRDAAESMAKLLELMGHTVSTADDGRSAITAAAASAPEVVLLDIGLPDIDGYEVCRQILANATGKPQVIAVTGWGQTDDRQRSTAAGFAAHLVKPVNFAALANIIAGQ